MILCLKSIMARRHHLCIPKATEHYVRRRGQSTSVVRICGSRLGLKVLFEKLERGGVCRSWALWLSHTTRRATEVHVSLNSDGHRVWVVDGAGGRDMEGVSAVCHACTATATPLATSRMRSAALGGPA